MEIRELGGEPIRVRLQRVVDASEDAALAQYRRQSTLASALGDTVRRADAAWRLELALRRLPG